MASPTGTTVLGSVLAPAPLPTSSKGIPSATVARLPVYLRALASVAAQGVDTISSGALAEAAGVSSAQLRKDLSYLGSYGTRGVGYDVEYLRFQIGRAVGSAHDWPVVIVGLGNLGTALANYSGFSSRGFRVVALVDSAPELIGREIHGLTIGDVADLEQIVATTRAAIAVIATPAEVAQAVSDRLVECGITSILDFAPVVLSVPGGVTVRKVDLGQELQILAYHEQRKTDQPAADGRIRDQPAADGRIRDQPAADGRIRDQPAADGRITRRAAMDDIGARTASNRRNAS